MPPAWRERSGPGSFRGVPFVVRSDEQTGGRKTVRHEYPLKDTPFIEDLGRKARGIRVTAYVIGGDYLTKRDALLAALEDAGAGPLVLPYQDERLVMVADYSVSQSDDEAGMATFSIEFEETEPKAFTPTVGTAARPRLGATADAGLLANKSSLSRRYSLVLPQPSTSPVLQGVSRVKPMPGWSLASASALVRDGSTALHRALAPVMATTQQLASLKRQTDALVTDASSLVRDPLLLATRFTSLLTDLIRWPATPVLGVKALLNAFKFLASTPRPVATTATRAREQKNYDAVRGFIRTGVLIQATRVAGDAADPDAAAAFVVRSTTGGGLLVDDVDDDVAAAADSQQRGQPPRLADGTRTGGYETYDEAIATREQLTDAIDELLEDADDELYAALVQLRADVIAAVPGERTRLPRLVTFTPTITIPSLVLTYRLYGDVALAEDVVDRNRVAHPGFVRGGRELQVLSHA